MGKEDQKTYWKSLNELAQNEEYRKFAEREFPEDATELKDGVSRRNFLQVMGASIALAGLASCRKPVEKILPHSRQPEYMVTGEPSYYATSMPFRGYTTGLLVESNEGRPTKIEGNELHPASGGKTNSHAQAELLSMYDQERSRNVRQNNSESTWDDFVSFCNDHFAETDRRIAIISEANHGPTFNRLRQEALERFPNADWVTFEPFGEENVLNGHQIAFGNKYRKTNRFDRANVIVSLEDDFMLTGDNNTQNVKRYTDSRKVESTQDEPNRLYIVESNYSLTGSNADHRLRLKSSDIEAFTFALAARLSQDIGGLDAFSGFSNEFSDHEWIGQIADELINQQGTSVLTAGESHSPAVHAAIAAINLAVGNAGETVEYLEVDTVDQQDQHQRFREIIQAMQGGEYDTVVLLGTNPVYNSYSDLDFSEALNQVDTSIHLGLHNDETAQNCSWHVNRAHFLESWNDGRSWEGELSIVQPLIKPLFDGKSDIEFLTAIVHGEDEKGHDLVKEVWDEIITDDFDSQWDTVLHDGILEDTGYPRPQVSLSEDFGNQIETALAESSVADQNEIELVLRPDPKIVDGRYANNGWLMELPDPMTKITWDNVALLSPQTARDLGISDSRDFGQVEVPVLSIETNDGTLELPAWVLPGLADNSITTYTGYGREIGKVAAGVGVNTFAVRNSESPLVHRNVSVSTTGQRYEIASTQDHHSMEGRPLVMEGSMDKYRENPTFADDIAGIYEGEIDPETGKPINLYSVDHFPDHEPQWGMTIDLNSCIGCGVCTIACQAENNIPVIGKREVRRGREMHWIRTDRYFSGDEEGNPKVLHQPVPCMHCEQAPCEQVCPVVATTHSDDGLNQMTYNRCIGTRYCSNNCPYKVRRFNFFNYAREFLADGEDPEIVQMAMNPEVTIRFRGVMEKCTYCVQRISKAKIQTKNETGDSVKPPDGMVKTACQQACPADAIEFGDLTDSESRVSKAKKNDRNYNLLEYLNVRPRTSYLAKLRNPSRNLAEA